MASPARSSVILKRKVGAAPRCAVGPAPAAGFDRGGPPAARWARNGADVGLAPEGPLILLTQLLAMNLDERRQRRNCPVTAGRTSGPRGQRRPYLDEPDLATDQKVGGSSPSEHAQLNGPLPGLVGAFSGPPGSHAGSHGHLSAAEQSPAHRLSRRPLIAFEQVPGHVLGDGDAGKPEHLGDHVQRRALGQHYWKSPVVLESPIWVTA